MATKRELEKSRNGWKNMVWITGDKRSVKFKDIEDYHLCNILNWIEGRGISLRVPNFWQRNEAYLYLRLEAEFRGLNWRHRIDPSYQGEGGVEFESAPEESLRSIEWARSIRSHDYLGTSVIPGMYRLADLIASREFRYADNRAGRFIKLNPIGVTDQSLRCYGNYRLEYRSTYVDTHEVRRCLIASLISGDTYLEDANVIVKVPQPR